MSNEYFELIGLPVMYQKCPNSVRNGWMGRITEVNRKEERALVKYDNGQSQEYDIASAIWFPDLNLDNPNAYIHVESSKEGMQCKDCEHYTAKNEGIGKCSLTQVGCSSWVSAEDSCGLFNKYVSETTIGLVKVRLMDVPYGVPFIHSTLDKDWWTLTDKSNRGIMASIIKCGDNISRQSFCLAADSAEEFRTMEVFIKESDHV